MTTMRPILRWTLGALALAALGAIALPACVGTPLPDPPSLTEALVSLSVTPQVDSVRLVGRAGAIRPGGATLRITAPPRAGILVATSADGSFGRIVPGAPGDIFYVELVLADEDRFVGAYTAVVGTAFVGASAGPDGDTDGTPDVIDCAPADPLQAGQRCGGACATDADCAAGQTCVAGLCSASAATCVAETCNGVDDDCDGIADDGDPGGGVPCTPATGSCPGTVACSGSPSCVPITPATRETCGNGLDDDCNGVIDDGC